jgi:Transglutaminase-like superfamily
MMRLLGSSFLAAAIGLGIGGLQPVLAQNHPPSLGGPQPSYTLVVSTAKRVHNELTFAYKAPNLQAENWVFYAARLPELAAQTDVRSSLDHGGRPVRELSDMGRSVLLAHVPVKGTKGRDALTIRVEYEATLRVRRLERREPGTPAAAVTLLSQRERRPALVGGHQFDFESPAFQSWLDEHQLRRRSGEEDVDFARRVFVEIKKRFRHVWARDMDRLASHICAASRSDGGGLAIVFVSALRANGIPARVLSGRWARPSQPGRNPADDVHVKAEFFATGVGWVPADIGSAVHSEKPTDGLEHFGSDDGDFLTLHVDTDLVLDTIYFERKTIDWLQTPMFWVTGTGTLEGLTAPVISKVRVEPIDLSRQPRKPQGQGPARAVGKPRPVSSGE